jgi:hypothetical protein
MLSPSEKGRLPIADEREACAGGRGALCHGIDIEQDVVDLPELMCTREREETRRRVDWVSKHCQTFQSTHREERKNLPCIRLRETIFQLNKK